MRYLYKANETFTLPYASIIESHPVLSGADFRQDYAAGTAVSSLPAGSYLIHEDTPEHGVRTRYLGIVGDSYTVMQLTIGAFTSDNFDHPLHSYRVPATYYVTLEQATKESTYKYFQREYGDDVLPHIMANGLEAVNPAYKQLDPNWESIPETELVSRLNALKAWWEQQSYTPLPGIASYTPCNALVSAMKLANMPILHSLCPEQNWSDGKWAINHWGMPNQPYYVAEDDFRKQTSRAERNVIAMCMNSYHLYMPHVVNWGDNVLSPSHYLRWHRSVESRYQPERFTNFLLDYLKAAECSQEPFFLIAGFEFGRTFGTTSMTDHNRKGIQRVVEAAKTRNVVFATASDVAAYYEQHIDHAPDSVWTQRDYLAGTRIMGKPVNSGPTIGMEMGAYKAVFEHLQNLPYYFYDYNETWSFAYNDTDAPNCHAEATRKNVTAQQTAEKLTIQVDEPLKRPTPIAVWDSRIQNPGDLTVHTPAVLDDGRAHQVIELPAGFSGELSLFLESVSAPSAPEFEGSGHPAWKVHTIGEADRRHLILFLDTPLTEELSLDWTAPKDCRLDDIDRPMQEVKAGETITLRFTPRKGWIRFWGLEASDLTPDDAIINTLNDIYIAEEDMRSRLEEPLVAIHAEQDKWIREHLPATEKIVYDIDCFGNATTQEKSRAFTLDRTVVENPHGVVAKEYADGGTAFAPGQSYWCHPRGLHVEIENLGYYRKNNLPFTVCLHCVSPKGQNWSYQVSVKSGFSELKQHDTVWQIPDTACDQSVYSFTIDPHELEIDDLTITIRSNQIAVLNDWFEDGGFIAALQRVTITEKTS